MGEVLLAAVAVGLLVAILCCAADRILDLLSPLLGRALPRHRQAREAERRAEMLLQDLLTPAEYTRLVTRGYLDVQSPSQPSRVYRVPRDGGIVVVYEGGRAAGGLCVQATEPIPTADAVAMHKLMIEGAEADYLRRANHLSIVALSRYGLGVLYQW